MQEFRVQATYQFKVQSTQSINLLNHGSDNWIGKELKNGQEE